MREAKGGAQTPPGSSTFNGASVHFLEGQDRRSCSLCVKSNWFWLYRGLPISIWYWRHATMKDGEENKCWSNVNLLGPQLSLLGAS